jgi:L-iditol 2-dehydrogenase
MWTAAGHRLNEIDAPNTAEEALALIANGRVDLNPLVTYKFVLADFATAIETFGQRKDGASKVAIKPNS